MYRSCKIQGLKKITYFVTDQVIHRGAPLLKSVSDLYETPLHLKIYGDCTLYFTENLILSISL